MRHFTKQEDDFLRANYLIMPVTRLSAALGRAKSVAGQRMKLIGLVVPPEIIEQRKKDSRLKTGNVPANKGKKWSEFMSKKGQRASRRTTFKKGGLPPTTLYDGCVTIRTDSNGDKYKYIRVKKARWVSYHSWIWRKKRGRIPKGHIIVFKDGDQMNCKISNLECISRRENMKRNTVHNLPKPLALVVQLRGALNRQINKHLKNINEK